MNICICGHSEPDHCPGQVSHSYNKKDSRMIAAADRHFTCATRHCLLPLCSCTAFCPLKAEAQNDYTVFAQSSQTAQPITQSELWGGE